MANKKVRISRTFDKNSANTKSKANLNIGSTFNKEKVESRWSRWLFYEVFDLDCDRNLRIAQVLMEKISWINSNLTNTVLYNWTTNKLFEGHKNYFELRERKILISMPIQRKSMVLCKLIPLAINLPSQVTVNRSLLIC